MYLLLFFIFVFIVEIVVIVCLVKLLYSLVLVEKIFPLYEDLILSEFKLIREEFKTLNQIMVMQQKTPAFTINDLGKISAEIIFRLVIVKKLTTLNVLTLLYQYRKQIFTLMSEKGTMK